MSKTDKLNPSNWLWLHDFTSVNLGMALDEVVRGNQKQRNATVA